MCPCDCENTYNYCQLRHELFIQRWIIKDDLPSVSLHKREQLIEILRITLFHKCNN